MDPIAKHLPEPTRLQNSMPSATRPSAAKLRLATATIEQMFKGRPDRGSEPEDYLVGLTETLAYLSEDDLAALGHPTEGLMTRLKFLPTPADVFEFLRERRARFDKVRATLPRNVLPPDPLPADTDFERRRAHVLELLGYNPQAKAIPVKRTLVPPTQADLDGLKSKLPPPAPATRELWAEIERQDAKHRDVA